VNALKQLVRAEENAAGRSGIPAPTPIALTSLTGRDTEVSLLRDRWEQAQEGMGQVVLIVGEPGLGKSRLVNTIKQIVMEQGRGKVPGAEIQAVNTSQDSSVVEWRCSLRFRNTALFPVSDYFHRFLNLDGDESTPAARFDRLARHLDDFGLGRADLVALFAKLLFLSPDERYPTVGLSPVREREETFRAMRQWLTACSDRHPLLFVIEDLHWIDASTLEFLGQFIAEGLHDRILTVLTFRPEFTTPWPAVAHQTSLALNRLTRRQVGELMRKETGKPLPDSLVAQIYHRTGGVPLLVEEFTRIIGESELARDIPSTLQKLVLGRLDRMSSNREVAQMAAALGREFHYDILAAVVSTDTQTLLAELEKLVTAEILCVKGQPRNCTFAFKHALLEEALYDALSEDDGKRLHRKIAEAMEARFPEVAERQPELLAQHFTGAGLPGKAVGYRLKAAVRSRERFANVEAISHLTKGLALLERLDPSPERDTHELELLGLLGTATIAARGYADSEVGPVFDRARALCKRLGETPQRFVMMWGNYAFHVVRGDFRLCADLAEEAMAFGERLNDPGILMEALFLRGLTMLYRGDFSGAHEWCDSSIAKYDDRARTAYWATLIGEDAGVTNRCYLALSLWHLGYPERALQLSRETLTLAREINHSFSLAYALHHTAWLHQLCRLGVETEAAGEEQIRIATDQGFPFWHASGTLYRAAGLLLQGKLEAGLALLENGLKAYRATGAGLGLPYYLSLLAEACIRARRFSDAQLALDEALALVEKNDEHFQEAELLRLRGELFLAESGDQTMAEDCFRRAIEIARRQQSRSFELRATTSLARLWRRQDRGHEAYEVMTAAHGDFTEGFTTPDLVEAGALLKELSDDQMRKEFADGVAYVRGCIPPPMQGKVAVDWRYIPSSTLGGDTIGYHWIDDDHLALYLIDVTGHGLDSALLSVSINNVIRSGSLPGPDMRRPDQVLATLNESFQGRQHSNKFFTIWYGVYCSSTRLLTWSGGGHHASLLFAPDVPASVSLSSTGPMMGILRGANFPVNSCLIPPGARLLIFSDGVFEIWRDKHAAWDWPACVSYLTTLSQGAETVLDELIEHVRLLRGSHQLDDDFSIIEARFDHDTLKKAQ
jgi:predicted ATPase/energy-coupling factor transporter ATP-binding protein EcfA2